MAKYVSPEIYNKYKQQVLDMSLAMQNYVGIEQQRITSCLTDAEIAVKLSLPVEDVREILMIAQNDLHSADAWMESDKEKRRKCSNFFGRRSKTT